MTTTEKSEKLKKKYGLDLSEQYLTKLKIFSLKLFPNYNNYRIINSITINEYGEIEHDTTYFLGPTNKLRLILTLTVNKPLVAGKDFKHLILDKCEYAPNVYMLYITPDDLNNEKAPSQLSSQIIDNIKVSTDDLISTLRDTKEDQQWMIQAEKDIIKVKGSINTYIQWPEHKTRYVNNTSDSLTLSNKEEMDDMVKKLNEALSEKDKIMKKEPIVSVKNVLSDLNKIKSEEKLEIIEIKKEGNKK